MGHTSRELLELYQAGRSSAAAGIFDRYLQRLLALARSRLSEKLRRRVDADDIVQSAYHSFFVRAANGDFQLERSGDLWRLLARITLNKLFKQAEQHAAAKRDVNRESPATAMPANQQTPEPTASQAAALTEELAAVMQQLSPDQRKVLTRTLQAETIREISHAMGRGERTIRRLLQTAREKIEKRLLDPPAILPTVNASGNAARDNAASGNAASCKPEVAVTLRFEDYTLLQLQGAGGMGRVYRAADRRLGTTVAVKALRKSWQSNARVTAQFVQEAQLLTRLRHPGIPQVEGLGQFPAGGYFMVMQFIDGCDLQTRVNRGPLPAAEAISIVRHVVNAVQYAHENGIVHCDLKPANVLIDQQGHVYVTDFGFAFVQATAARNSNFGGTAAGGTAGYIAPEILLQTSTPAPSADIYALGVLLCNLITGALPCPSGQLASSQTAGGWQEIYHRCTHLQPSKRYTGAAALLTALDQLKDAGV